MTRTTNARIAGFTYLFYAAIGICIEPWLPALVFQVALALWLLINGVATPARGQPA